MLASTIRFGVAFIDFVGRALNRLQPSNPRMSLLSMMG
jgi:hypothetical protein